MVSRVRAGTAQPAGSDSCSTLLHPNPNPNRLTTFPGALIDSEIFSRNSIQRFCVHVCGLSNRKKCQTAKHNKTLRNAKISIFPMVLCSVSSRGPSLFPIWKALQVRPPLITMWWTMRFSAQVYLCLSAAKTCLRNLKQLLKGSARLSNAKAQRAKSLFQTSLIISSSANF